MVTKSRMYSDFAQLFDKHTESLVRMWADRIYADRRTDLTGILSYRALVEFVPELLDELVNLLNRASDEAEVAAAAKRLRVYPQTRFQQGILIDEVAHELSLMRKVLNAFMWREAEDSTRVELRELRSAFRLTNALIDELVFEAILVYATSERPRMRTRTSGWRSADTTALEPVVTRFNTG
jgi:hypothetical protein